MPAKKKWLSHRVANIKLREAMELIAELQVDLERNIRTKNEVIETQAQRIRELQDTLQNSGASDAASSSADHFQARLDAAMKEISILRDQDTSQQQEIRFLRDTLNRIGMGGIFVRTVTRA